MIKMISISHKFIIKIMLHLRSVNNKYLLQAIAITMDLKIHKKNNKHNRIKIFNFRYKQVAIH